MKKIRVIMYNNIGDYPAAAMEDGMSAAAFARDMAYLAQKGYRVLTLAEALTLAAGRTPVPERTLALTFDGGYRDAHTHVVPVLKKHGFPATFFIPPGHIGGHLEIGGVPIPCMSWQEVAQLAADGFAIGAYLLSGRIYHPTMQGELISDIHKAVRALSERLHQPLRYVSLREGIPDAAVHQTLKACGIESLLTKCPTKRRPHRFCIGRIQIDDDDPNIFRIKISANYLRFKDSRTWPYMRKYKLDRLAHRISNAINERRSGP